MSIHTVQTLIYVSFIALDNEVQQVRDKMKNYVAVMKFHIFVSDKVTNLDLSFDIAVVFLWNLVNQQIFLNEQKKAQYRLLFTNIS